MDTLDLPLFKVEGSLCTLATLGVQATNTRSTGLVAGLADGASKLLMGEGGGWAGGEAGASTENQRRGAGTEKSSPVYAGWVAVPGTAGEGLLSGTGDFSVP